MDYKNFTYMTMYTILIASHQPSHSKGQYSPPKQLAKENYKNATDWPWSKTHSISITTSYVICINLPNRNKIVEHKTFILRFLYSFFHNWIRLIFFTLYSLMLFDKKRKKMNKDELSRASIKLFFWEPTWCEPKF